jgi:hypothetical protein
MGYGEGKLKVVNVFIVIRCDVMLGRACAYRTGFVTNGKWIFWISPRRYIGCECRDLPLTVAHVQALYRDLYCLQAILPQALNLNMVAALFALSFGISAWK